MALIEADSLNYARPAGLPMFAVLMCAKGEQMACNAAQIQIQNSVRVEGAAQSRA